MPSIDKKVMVSVMAGVAALGLVYWGVSKLPSGNVVTDTAKKVADATKS